MIFLILLLEKVKNYVMENANEFIEQSGHFIIEIFESNDYVEVVFDDNDNVEFFIWNDAEKADPATLEGFYHT